MSRVLMSTLAFGAVSLMSTSALAQPLNINPFPMDKAGTLSVQEPQIMTPEPVEEFAKEAEEEILRLEREQEEERARKEKVRQEAQERALLRQAEKEQVDLANAAKEAQEEAERLERENAALAAALEAKKQEEAKMAALEAKKQERERAEAEAISLKEKNQQLAAELKAAQEEKRKQAELEFAMQALEAQKKADAAVEPVMDRQVSTDLNSGVDPLFDSAAVDQNPVSMTPMPGSVPNNIIEVRASDLGLVEPALDAPVEATAPVKRERQVSRQMDLVAAGLEVIPYPVSSQISQNQAVSSASVQKRVLPVALSANAGESVEDVLRSWSQAEGVGFLWKTTQRYDVQKPLSSHTDYAASVQSLLDQFGGNDVRPVGRLEVDPVTGTRTLIILSE